ncbi:MAG: HNH endonuclease signature motif containing protein [bacterium]|nr:HNH endonuclease signature motif containing protein [bacterium]
MLGKIFPENNPHLNQNYSLSLYWILSRISLLYKIPEDQYSVIRNNFEKLDIARLEAMNRDYSERPNDDIFEDLSLAMSRGNTGIEGIQTRHDIIGAYLFNGVELEPLPNVDPNRIYSHEEKLILFTRAGGKCQLEHFGNICGHILDFDEAVVDHIKPHSAGGLTLLENGRISYKLCNISRGVRDDFNPATECKYAIISTT